ncbi:hypothetical protein BD410DRAFT_250704 [Rickenella mellea]|uniref:Uncharacterized protein n=1 Tax=Rickenella mellea TaxID=50990 RepID=A0A4Y7QPJ6_9AGAM|nr:hypothetical protein BD410DRAFT_250704 [Rickenella mellea]
MQTTQPCLLVIPGHKRGSISESTIGSIASSDDGYVWTAKHRPCPTCKKGWIEAGSLSPIDEGAQGANGHRSIWDKVPRVTWLTRPLNNPILPAHACPANCEARHSKFVVTSDLPPTPDPAFQPKGGRSILSGSASVASRGDNDSLASGRNPRSVKFSEEASVIYYDYDMMLCESTDDLSVISKTSPAAATLGVLHRIVSWIKRVANKKKAKEKSSEKDRGTRDIKGKEVPVISGPYRLWDASASVEHEVCRRPSRRQPERRPSLKDMFKAAGCT